MPQALKNKKTLRASNDWQLLGRRPRYFIGIDEVGRGCLAGPVVAACFAYRTDQDWCELEPAQRIDDSKKLSATQRKKSVEWLKGLIGVHWAIGLATAKEIDQNNILQATFLAMQRAYETVLAQNPELRSKAFCFVDGSQQPPFLPMEGSLTIVKGDSQSFAVASAALLAKVYRDEWMAQLAERYPVYGWQQNVGYGTAQHLQSIREYGFTPEHRRSFEVRL